MTDVFLVHHTKPLPDDEEDVKLLGVFSSEEKAQHTVDFARSLPGFSETPDCFSIDKYQVDRRAWTEGFITWAEALKDKE